MKNCDVFVQFKVEAETLLDDKEAAEILLSLGSKTQQASGSEDLFCAPTVSTQSDTTDPLAASPVVNKLQSSSINTGSVCKCCCTCGNASRVPEVEPALVTPVLEVKPKIVTIDKGCQVNSGDFLNSFTESINSDIKLNAVTGVATFKLLNQIVLTYSKLEPENNRNALTNKARVMLTLIKMKLNLTFRVLSVLFEITANTCRNIFQSVLPTLAFILKFALRWPSKDEILRNMPVHFKNYRNTFLVLDCTEVHSARSKCAKCRVMSYSHYKGTFTVKFLVGVTPGGLFIFISKGYGGRASDKLIFLESGILQRLEPHVDALMVDRGFLIAKECAENNIKLIHPPFLKNKKQFSHGEAVFGRDVSGARVHVERAIQRLKIFKILKDTISCNLIGMCDDIMNVAASLVNLSNSILDDNKFL